MYGIFNGAPLRDVGSLRTISMEGLTRHTFTVIGGPFPPLEQQLRLDEPALLIRVIPANRRPGYSVLCGSNGLRDHNRVEGLA